MKQEISPLKAGGLILIALAAVGGAAFWFTNSGAAAGHAPETEQLKPHEAQEYYKQYTESGKAPAGSVQGGAPGMPPATAPGGAPGGPQGGEAAARARGVPPSGN